MKKVKMKYFSLYSPRIERKGHLQEVYMKLFHKDEFHKYMRTLARQRIEDKLFFKEISIQKLSPFSNWIIHLFVIEM